MQPCLVCTTLCPDNKDSCPNCGSTLESALEKRPEGSPALARNQLPERPVPEAPEPGLSARFSPGTLLAGRYRLVDMLGRGGMGEVYRAQDLKLGGTVALKFLPQTVEHNDLKLEALLSEARLARTVSHPNICRVHDVGVHVDTTAGELHFISMEYIDGEDLASLLRRIGRLPKPKALQIARELSTGLAAVHASGLLHRDIKPGNVMIDGQGRAQLTDFGLAILGLERISRSGTPAYMAPEQHATRETTVSSDLYALGLVLYEIFTGTQVYRAKSPIEYAYLHLEMKPEPPSSRVRDLDPEIERILLNCLQKMPARRPASAETVVNALDRIDPDGPTAAATVTEQGEVLRTLLLCDLVGSTALVESLGDRRAAELGKKHDRLARDLLAHHEGREIDKTDGFLLLFERPIRALRFALEYHEALDQLSRDEGSDIAARVGIHFGEVWLRENPADDVARGAKPVEVEGLAKAVAARLMSLARGGQTLLGRGAFDLARRAAVGLDDAVGLRWLDHGAWRLYGVADPVDVFEVGRQGHAPLAPPLETEKVRRLVMQPRIEGWRPAPGLAVPHRPNWQVERRLGEGGFGEVWLVRHVKTGERRGFKFCFDSERLRALQREITLFRLLKEELGERPDINRILDWNLDQAPYFIESEYTRAGDLGEWTEGEGGLEAVPLETRLELVAQVATALGAAHSVGVLHKDVKPSNVLIQLTPEGGVQAQLADFGIGQVTERERLASAGITILGLTEQTFDERSSSAYTGTRLYMAPELLEGHAPTLQADLYALGVLLYQMVVGDLGRAIAPGWRRDVDDTLLADDIACFVDRSPERRPSSAQEVAERLRQLSVRRREHEATLEAQRAFETSQRRRRIYRAVATTALVALVVVSVLALWAMEAGREERRARESTEAILGFMVSLFEVTDPFGMSDPGASRGETITAREILDQGAARVDTEFEERPLVQARLMNTFGDIYRSLGLYDTAEPLLERSLETRRQQLGEHPDVAASLHQRGKLLYAKGDYAEATSIHRQALELRQRLLGVEHPQTLHSVQELASSLRKARKFEEARKLLERNVEIQARVLGPEHPRTLVSTKELAITLTGLGEYSRARRLQEKTLRIQERTLGAEHLETLRTRGNLASTLQGLGDAPGARQHWEQILEIEERVLGPEHPATLWAKNRLVSVLLSRGDDVQAQRLLESLVEIQERKLGSEDFATLDSMLWLAITHRSLGHYAEARPLLEHIAAIQERLLGAEHPRTLVVQSHLGAALNALGDPRGLQILEETLETQERILGSEHFGPPLTMYSLAIAHRDRGDLQQAAELQKTALEIQKRILGTRHRLTLTSMANLGAITGSLGDFDQARQLQERALGICKQAQVAGSPLTLNLMNSLAGTLWKLGEVEKAKDLAQQAFGELETSLGRKNLHTTRAARQFLEIAVGESDFEATGRWLEALLWLTERDEQSLDLVEQRKTRRYVLDILAEIDGGSSS